MKNSGLSQNGVKVYVAQGGGYGGYGAGGGKAEAIGGGGYGGGGGGSGASGSRGYSTSQGGNSFKGIGEAFFTSAERTYLRYTDKTIDYLSSKDFANFGGNGGGMNGNTVIYATDGSGYAENLRYWEYKGGNGAAHGSAGTIQENGTKDVSGEFTTISYDVSSSATATVHPAAVNYEISHADRTTVTIPSYADSDADVRFYGWQVSVYASSSTTGAPLTSGSERYYGGETFKLAQSTMGRITLKAVTEKLGGVHAADTASMTYTGSQPELTYHTYKVKVLMDGTQTAQKGTILIGQTAVAPGSDGTYTLVDQDDSDREVKIGGQSAGTVKADAEADISYETLKVTVTGLVPSDVCLGGNGAPELTNASSGQNILYMTDRLAQAGDGGSYDIYVDGRKIPGITASYGTPAAVVYHTITAAVTSNGTVANAELHDAAGGVLPMKLSNGSYTCTELAGNTVYTLYINGEATGQSADFSKDQTLQAAFNRYTTNITTQLDGVPTDMGRVKLGDERMIRTGTGRYMLITQDKSEASLTVDGKVTGSVTPGTSKKVDYYSITYLPTDGAEGIVPEDRSCYLSGTKATLLSGQGLLKGGQAFSGWMVDGVQHQPGNSIAMTSKVTATACWSQTDISSASGFTLKLAAADFTYNGTPGIPELTLARDGSPLQKGRDYTVAYQNTNTANGHSDTQGSEENAINAGTVTVTVSGTGDYKGHLTASYQIAKAPLTAAGLVAADREYNGTMTVQIGTDDATLSGIIGSDDIRLQSAAGRLTSADAGEGKTVRISNALLTGAAVSEYTLEPVEPVKVNIAKKPLTQDMFSLAAASVQYNAAAQTPQVTAHDMGQVAGKNADLITSADYSCTYADNIHAGTAAVLIHAGRPVKDAGGNVTYTTDGNYSGSVTVNFTITPAPVTIQAGSATSVYAQPVADVTNDYTISGTVYSASDLADLAIRGTTSVQAGYDAGIYISAVNAAWNQKNTDYKVTAEAADYTVTKASAGALKVTSTGYAGVYDGNAHGIRVTADLFRTDENVTVYYSTKKELNADNYQNTGEDVSASSVNPQFTDAGTTKVYYYVASPNYATGVSGEETVTIAKAPLKVTAKAHSITYGEDPAALTEQLSDALTKETIEIAGLVGSDTAETVFDSSVSVTYTSNDYRRYGDTGTYTLTPSGLTAKNYDITCQEGILTVLPKEVTFAWPGTVAYPYNGAAQTFTATVVGTVNGDTVTAATYESGKTTGGRVLESTQTNAGQYTAAVKTLGGAKAADYTFAAGGATVSKDWEITKASNSWLIGPSIQGWTAGESANAPVAQAKYGTEEIKYTYKADASEGTYSDAVPTAAGSYLMKAEVPEGADYEALAPGEPVKFTISAKNASKTTVYAQVQDVTVTSGESVQTVTVNYADAEGKAVETTTINPKGTLTYRTAYEPGTSGKRDAGTYVLMAEGLTSESYNIIYRPGTLTVKPKKVTLTWSSGSLFYTGSEQSVTATVNSSALLSGDQVVVAAYNSNTATAAGSYQAQATALSGTGAGSYELDPTTAAYSWSIAATGNSFVITPLINGWTYGEEAQKPQGTAKFGTVTFYYQEKKDGVADWNIFNPLTKEVPTAAGTYRLIAKVAAGDGYRALESGNDAMIFTIAPAQMTITAQDASGIYGDALQSPLTYTTAVLKGKVSDADKEALKIELTTQASSSGPVGNYPIEIKTAENSNITVTKVNGIYTVARRQMTVTAQPVSAVYDARPHGIGVPSAADGDTAVSGVKIYYDTKVLTSQNYGSAATDSPVRTDTGSTVVYYYVTADNYVPVAGQTTLTVTPKEVTVTAEDANITYGDTAADNGVHYEGFAGNDTAKSLNLKPAYVFCAAGTGSAYAPGSSAGTYQIIPKDLSTQNYTFSYQPGTLTVARRPLSAEMFTLSGSALTYNGGEQKPAVAASDQPGSVQLIVADDYKVTYQNNVRAGTETAVAVITASEKSNYTGTLQKKFTILPCPLTATAAPAQSIYNEPLAALAAPSVTGSVAAGDNLHFAAVTTVRKGYAAGTYQKAVSVSYDTANTDYSVTVVPADYTVTAATLTVQKEDYQGTYDGLAHSASLTVKTGKFLTYAKVYYSDSVTVSGENYHNMKTAMPSFTKAGSHTVYYYAVCDSYQPVSGTLSVNIQPAPLKVTPPDAELTYGDDPAALLSKLQAAEQTQEQLSFSGFVNGETAESALTGKTVIFATDYARYGTSGSYQITCTGLTADNYSIACQPAVLKVNPRPVAFTWTSSAYTYSGREQQITASVSAASKARGEDEVIAGSYTGNIGTAAGTYTAAVTGLSGAAAADYTIAEAEKTAVNEWSIKRADNSFVITPSIADWAEGQKPNAPLAAAKYGTVVYSYSSKEDGVYTADVPAKAGDYYLLAEVAGSANYTELSQKVKFRILSAGSSLTTITITAPDRSLTYGDELNTAAIAASESTVQGLPQGESLQDVADGTLTFVSGYTKGSSAGRYELAPAGLTAKEGYAIVYKAGTVTVSRKSVKLIWSGSSFIYNGSMHKVTAAVVSTDLINGDAVTVSDYESDAAAHKQNAAISAGSYTAHAISFAGAGADNYEIASGSAQQEWTITKARNEFTQMPSIGGWTYGNTPSVPQAAAQSGTIRYLYADAAEGSYTETVPVHAGDWYMKAVVDGTDDYAGLESTPAKFTVSRAEVSLVADDVSGRYGTELSGLTYVMTGAVKSGDDLGISLTTTAGKGSAVGEYPITVTYKSNPDYNVTVTGGTYFITPLTEGLQVTASGADTLYDGTAHGISVKVQDADGKAVSGTNVYYSTSELTDADYATGSLVSPALTDVGTLKVYYYVTSGQYAPVSGSRDVVIRRKTVQVTAGDETITYGESPASVNVSLSGLVNGDTIQSLDLNPTVNIAYRQYDAAGTYPIKTVPFAENGNYTYSYTDGVLTVGRRPVTFFWRNNVFTYDGTAKRVTATVKGLVNGDDVTAGNYDEDAEKSIQNSAVNAGAYTARVLTLSGAKASSYVIPDGEATASHVWRIDAGTNAFTTAPSINSWTYGQTAQQPAAKAAYGTVSYLYSSEKNGTYTAQQPQNAGTYYMKAIVPGTGSYAALESAPVAFAIAKARITVAADNVYAKPGEPLKTLTCTMQGSAVQGDEISVELSTTAKENSAAGTYLISVNVTAGNNYEIATLPGSYYITDLDLDIGASGADTVYDGQEHGITVNLTGTDAVRATVYYSTAAVSDTDIIAGRNAQKVSPVLRDVGSQKVYYYVVVDQTVFGGMQEVRITAAPLTVRALDQTIYEGDAAANGGVTFDGFVRGEDASVLSGTLHYSYGSYAQGSSAGTYDITPYGLASGNYRISYVSGVLTVRPVQKSAEIKGVTAVQNLIYNGQPQAGYVGTPSAADGEVTEFTYRYQNNAGNVLAGAPTDAGDYQIVISIPASNIYYKGTVTIPFSIAKKDITVTAPDQAILAGQTFTSLPPVYSGFLDADNQDGAAMASAGTVSPAAGSDLTRPGTAVLEVTAPGTFSAAAAKNYAVGTTVNGKLTILEAAGETRKAGDSPDGSGSSYKPDGKQSGIIQTAVVREPGLPPTTLQTDLNAAVAGKLLDTGDVNQVKKGENALVYLVMADADNTSEKSDIRQKALDLDSSMTVGMYFDLSMYKRIGSNAPEKIPEPGTKVTVGITLTGDLILTDSSKVRTYTVIYEHNGDVAAIAPTVDGDVLSFDADRFSTYSIAYVDTVKASGGQSSGDIQNGNNAGNSTGNQVQTDQENGHGQESQAESAQGVTVPGAGQSSVIPAGTEPVATGGEEHQTAIDKPGSAQSTTKDRNGIAGADGKAQTTQKTKDSAGSGKSTSEGTGDHGNQKRDGQLQTVTLQAQIVDKIPEEVRRQLADAVSAIRKADSAIEAGPYVQVPADQIALLQGRKDKVTFTLDVPKDLQAKDRTFYLVAVDKDGKVHVLKNESLESGTIAVTGDPELTYQIVYEDGSTALSGMLSENGTLENADGSVVTVSTNHCFWHWFILLLGIAGGLLELIFRKKKKVVRVMLPLDTVLMLLCMIAGFCVWDIPAFVIGLLLVVFGYIQGQEMVRQEKENDS